VAGLKKYKIISDANMKDDDEKLPQETFIMLYNPTKQ